jgi:hypothetical protein
MYVQSPAPETFSIQTTEVTYIASDVQEVKLYHFS